ncbi:STAS domain-containing protein [bacterium]|nr:STAS domain-containing protein [bacterium]
MKLGLERVDDILVVTVPGRTLDLVQSSELKRAIYPLLAEETKAVLDLSKLDFIDSSGLGVFVACAKMLKEDGGDLKICGMTKQVRSLFKLVKMHAICELFDTTNEAIESFKRVENSDRPARSATRPRTTVREVEFGKRD